MPQNRIIEANFVIKKKKMPKKRSKDKEPPMHNITINIPDIYDENIQWLKRNKIIASRSEAIRTALKEFLLKEYSETLILLDPDNPSLELSFKQNWKWNT